MRDWGSLLKQFARGGWPNIVLTVLVVLIVAMLIVPLPTWLLDILLTTNIALGVLILLVALSVKDGLSFTSFPTLLLLTTLYRLALNVSSTRLILLQADAGHVIRAFGDFVVQGNYVVGAILFLVLTLIQFLVIAKGSERVAEVGARFTLDAMPGKQLAIDAELRMGACSQDEARLKRRQLHQESQFYGAMDGAMKFVKGDAVAGIVISIVSIVAGVSIGVFSNAQAPLEALRLYGLLTIGDGLLSQIPSLLISTAAGLIVTRVASTEPDATLGNDILKQLAAHPSALAVCALLLALLGLVPGLPTVPFMVLAAMLGAGSLAAFRRGQRATPTEGVAPTPMPALALEVPHASPEERRGLDAALARVTQKTGVALPPLLLRERAGAHVLFVRGTPIGTLEPQAWVEAFERLLSRHIAAFVGVQETQHLLDALEREAPALVRNVVPKPITLPVLADVLRQLAEEGVHLGHMHEICEALAQQPASIAKDSRALTDAVRVSLKRALTHQHAPLGVLQAHLLDSLIEDTIRDAIPRSTHLPAIPPHLARDIVKSAQAAYARQPGPFVTQPDTRRFVRALLAAHLPQVVVLSTAELDPSTRFEVIGTVGVGDA
jgi:type III secretion protein V